VAGDQVVEYEVDGAVAIVTLNRPDARNAINAAAREGLVAAMVRADADPGVRAIIVRGAGDRAFSAGADVREPDSAPSLVAARAARQAPQFTDVIAATATPTIAAIHGYCLGGGLEMALACDLRIAASDAVLGLPEVTIGRIPGAGGTQRLSRLVGLGPALQLALTGERIDAATALQVGLVSRVVAPEELEGAARAIADRIAANAPLAVAYAKEAIVRGYDLSVAEGLRLERDLATLLLSTADRTEGSKAFLERRRPVFRGE
jgi:enoyl-CoA hydratase